MIRVFIIGTLVPLVLELILFLVRAFVLKKARDLLTNEAIKEQVLKSKIYQLYNSIATLIKNIMIVIALVIASIFIIFGSYLIYDLFIR